MKATLTFLIKFYKSQTEIYNPEDKIEIEVDSEGTPLDSFWCEQIRFNDNHFKLETKKNKSK